MPRPVTCPGCLEVSPSGLWRPPAKRVEGYPLSRVQIPPPPPDPHGSVPAPTLGRSRPGSRAGARAGESLDGRGNRPVRAGHEDGLGLSEGSSSVSLPDGARATSPPTRNFPIVVIVTGCSPTGTPSR